MIREKTGKTLLAMSLCAFAAIVVGTGSAHAAGGYAGLDFVKLDTKLDYSGGPEKYKTSHARVKGGYQFNDNLSLEGHVLTRDDDTTTDSAGLDYNLDTGVILAVFAKAQASLGAFDVYGLLGASRAKTEYTQVASGTKNSDTNTGLAYGLGAQYAFTDNLRGSVDYIVYYDDDASYNSFFSGPIDQRSAGFGIGISYVFK